jgi:hypothetical protein
LVQIAPTAAESLRPVDGTDARRNRPKELRCCRPVADQIPETVTVIIESMIAPAEIGEELSRALAA